MAYRSIGQERFGFAGRVRPTSSGGPGEDQCSDGHRQNGPDDIHPHTLFPASRAARPLQPSDLHAQRDSVRARRRIAGLSAAQSDTPPSSFCVRFMLPSIFVFDGGNRTLAAGKPRAEVVA